MDGIIEYKVRSLSFSPAGDVWKWPVQFERQTVFRVYDRENGGKSDGKWLDPKTYCDPDPEVDTDSAGDEEVDSKVSAEADVNSDLDESGTEYGCANESDDDTNEGDSDTSTPASASDASYVDDDSDIEMTKPDSIGAT